MNAADEVVPEVNLFDKTSEATVKDCQFLPENKTLQDVIDAGLFEKVDNHLKPVEKSIHKCSGLQAKQNLYTVRC